MLFLTDIFGLALLNSKLLADDLARNGFAVYMPDYLNGDPIPIPAMGPGSTFDRTGWFSRHGEKETRPPLDKVIAGLREQGVTSFAASGYCLGGRYVADLIYDDIIKAGLFHHPSRIESPSDLQKIRAKNVPTLWNVCEFDGQCSRHLLERLHPLTSFARRHVPQGEAAQAG